MDAPRAPRVRRREHRSTPAALALACAALLAPGAAAAQSRTRWEMHPGDGLIPFPVPITPHGSAAEYAFASIPAVGDPRWVAAPDPNNIGYDVRSALCDAGVACSAGADFTYFRTIVCVPDPRDLSSVTVTLGDVDDGARLTVFNSAHPAGVTPANGFAFLGGGAITSGDFASVLRVGEPNVLVITQVDDCCAESRLRDVSVTANGRALPATTPAEECNGLDDNCNGAVDEGFGQTTCGVGACQRTVDNCSGGRTQRCTPGAPSTEVCNGLDDDCDGAVDDGLGESTCGTGICQRTTSNCAGGVAQACTPGAPAAEVCNRQDDDCDGVVDNLAAECAPDGGCVPRVCEQDLRLEGRAGPIGDCQCRARVARSSGRAASTALLLVVAGALACAVRARRRARRS